ncbi:MAG: mechanosensitive ion channel domain-containing protein, partial [Gammaproteobacteria bacterium]
MSGLFFFLVCLSPLAYSADFQGLGRSFDKIEDELSRAFFTSQNLEQWSKSISDVQSEASYCIDKQTAELELLQKNIESLGEAVASDPAEVQEKRRQVEEQKTESEKTLSNCRLLLLRSQELSERISSESNALLAKQLLAKSPNIATLVTENINNPNVLASSFKLYLEQGVGLDVFTLKQWLTGFALLCIAWIVGFKLKKTLRNSIRHEEWHDDFSSQFSLALFSTLTQYLPQLIAACSGAGLIYFFTQGQQPVPFVAQVAFALVVYFIAVILIRFLFVPALPAKRFLPLAPAIAKGLARRLVMLVFLGLAGYLAFYTDIANRIPESPLLLARRLFSLIVVMNLAWALGLLFRSPKLTELRWLILLVIGALALTLGAEWFGYQNLAFYLRRMILGLLLIFGATVLLLKLTTGIFNGVDDGSYGWTRNLRQMLSVQQDQPVPGSGWFRLLFSVLIWISFAVASLRVLDASDEVLGDINHLVMHGFDIGSLHITPIRIFWAIISLSLLLTLIGWLRSRLEKRWLQRVQMDRGAREAMVTISGYVMVTLAILFALSIAGLDFSNLAIIAGALSVGIGFGLQNIVNNFVSGLILLFERPIKTGDWVVVGQT